MLCTMTSDEEPASRPNYVDYLFAERASRAEYFHLALAVHGAPPTSNTFSFLQKFPSLGIDEVSGPAGRTNHRLIGVAAAD